MNELYHHGIKGQKWGVRRFQNQDGSLTSAGKNRYGKSNNKRDDSNKKSRLTDKQKKILKIGAAVTGTALLAYGTYKLVDNVKINKDVEQIVSKAMEDAVAKDVEISIQSDKNLYARLGKTYNPATDSLRRKTYDSMAREKIFQNDRKNTEVKKLVKDVKETRKKNRKVWYINNVKSKIDPYSTAFGKKKPFEDPRNKYMFIK